VLVVHGIGSQRAQQTVRGVVDAVWFDKDNPTDGSGTKKAWTHPEHSGTDLDLAVITTSEISGTADRRNADFHEFYWAHLMSETKAVAVLLWLYELGRKGPHFKPGMNGLWWVAAWFLALLNLSVAVLVLRAVALFVQLDDSLHKLVMTPYLMAAVAAALALYAVHAYDVSARLPSASKYLVMVIVAPVASFVIIAAAATFFFNAPFAPFLVAKWITDGFLPTVVAAIAGLFLMGTTWGWKSFKWPYALSFVFLGSYLALTWLSNGPVEDLSKVHLPWGITSQSSAVAAFLIVGIYLAVNACFLQPYLGDAARYFRNSPANVAVRREIRKQAVETLERLHLCGEYDRIIVVAHSLGSVVAYDMLRAYYSRINSSLPDPRRLGPDFEALDEGSLSRQKARARGREIIRRMAAETEAARKRIASGIPQPGDAPLKAWLVTDFVTLGSPLTHAHYLMCSGADCEQMAGDFERRTRERELPTCPPRKLNDDNCLTFVNPRVDLRRFHHGGQFGLTRWTNLYFPMTKLFWGDAIGGPVAAIFRDPGSPGRAPAQHVADVPVYTSRQNQDDFFSHTLYWEISKSDCSDGYDAPHIVALKNAIDLDDAGSGNAM
jgi:hypothetical protein